MSSHFEVLKTFFEKPVCQAATKPLRDGVQIALHLDGADPVTLEKQNGVIQVVNAAPKKADMSFWVPAGAIETLSKVETTDVGEVGVEILKLMAHSDPAYHMTAKVHIGVFDLLRHGYLGVLPLGGPTVMKFLGSKGFGNMNKIREAISRMRS
jgi:hypothetical protein